MAAISGVYLSELFDSQVAQVYTGYIPPARKNRLFQKALIDLSEDKQANDDKQKTRDELSFIVKTEQPRLLNNGQIYVSPLQIIDVTYVGTLITVTFLTQPNVLIGQNITISGVTGTNIGFAVVNGIFTVTNVTGNTVQYVTGVAPIGAYTADTGNATYANMYDDYWHLRTVRVRYVERQYDIHIISATNTSPVKITTSSRTSLRNELIQISSALGNTAINGQVYTKQLNPTQYELYSDPHFLVPIVGNGVYVPDSAIVSRFYYQYAKPLYSDKKISPLSTPTVTAPYYEISERLVKFYPLGAVECTMDYSARPAVEINVLNSTINYSLYWPEKFLNRLVVQAAFIFTSEMVKDQQSAQALAVDAAANP